jgi:predicted phosphodiesterase
VRVAALYDVHGNLPALEAVLAEVDGIGRLEIVCGGDVSAGPMPGESLELLREAGARFVRGNADREPEGWPAEQLTTEQRDFLRGLPLSISLDVEGLGAVLFCHATPRNDIEFFLEHTPESVAAPMLGASVEQTIVCGHTHMQFDRSIAGRRVVNAGSVGMPYEGAPGAYWALLGPGVEHRRTEYDLEAAARRIRATAHPDADELVRENVLVVPSRAEAVAVFEPMVGRAP